MGFNGIMSGIKDFVLGEQYSDKKVAYLWNNISKLSLGGRKGVESMEYMNWRRNTFMSSLRR